MTQGLGDIASAPCPWLQYSDYEMDPIWRSQNGSITPVTEWSLYGDHGMDPIRRSVTPPKSDLALYAAALVDTKAATATSTSLLNLML